MTLKFSSSASIYILHENDEWVIPLRAALRNLALPFEEWFLDEGLVDLSTTPPEGVFYNRMSASSHSRGHYFAPEYTESVLRWLEAHDRRVLNSSASLRLEVSKTAQYAALNRHGIQTPKTLAVVGRKDLSQAARSMTRPFITKHNRAGKGLGVRLFETIEAFGDYIHGIEFEESRDGITLIQEYIQAPEPYITRVEFVGGEFIYAVRVNTSDGFELCPADACVEGEFCPATSEKFEIIPDFNHPLIEKYQRLMKSCGIEIAGFEFITDRNGRAYTYDINMNTNYNSAAEERFDDARGMHRIAAFLAQELEDIRGARIQSAA